MALRLYFLLLLFPCLFAKAQQSVEGRVMNMQNEPLTEATILLLHAKDSLVIKGTFTNKEGLYVFENIVPGSYRIAASMVGHDTAFTEIFTLQKEKVSMVPSIVLKETAVLDEVVVKARKPLFELKQDRIIMNVSASPAFSGNTGLELLQKTPGVIVNRQNNSITMNAKGEVMIMINNKIQRVPNTVLIAMLEGMRAENIEQIEIIQQPPAKYDASGAAGIIHIVLKENEDKGTNGNASLIGGYGQREKAGFNLNLNSRKSKINWYCSYNFNLDKSNNYEVNHFREYDYEGNIYYHENYVTLRNYSTLSNAGNIGVDIDLGKSTVLGLLLNGTKSEQVWGKNAESISYDYINDSMVGKQNFLLDSKTDVALLSANLNLLQKLGSRSSLNFNLDYAGIRYDNFTNLKNSYDTAMADRISLLDFWIASIDNTNEIGKGFKLETGVKGTFNTTAITTTSQSFDINPNLFGGRDKINERILAGYVSMSKKVSKKLNAELGFRYEHYTYTLNSERGQQVTKDFKNPFPIIRLQFDIDSVNHLQLAFNRSITRPSFFHLTSFLLILDSSLVVYANPRLSPSFTNTFKITYAYKSFMASLSYLRRTGQIYFYNTVNKALHLQTSVPANLDVENIIEAQLIFPASVFNWWKINGTVNGLYHTVKDETNHAIVFQNSIFTFLIQLNNTFRFGKGWTGSINAQYQSPYLVGDQELFDYPYLHLGIKKDFPGGSSLGFVFQDATNSSAKRKWEYYQPELGIRTFGNNNFSERQIRITYTHPFGNKKLLAKRERSTGTGDVKSRM